MKDEPLVIRFPRPVASKKNKRAANGRGGTVPNKQAVSDERSLRTLAVLAAKDQGWEMAEDDEIRVEVDFIVETEELTIRVWNLGPRPKGKTGRARDLHGMLETVCDALQPVRKSGRAVYRDDRQVAEVGMRRVYPGETANQELAS